MMQHIRSTDGCFRSAIMATGVLAGMMALTSCAGASPPRAVSPGEADAPTSAAPDSAPATDDEPTIRPDDEPAVERTDDAAPAETCDWDAPKLAGDAAAPTGRDGDLPDVLVGAWQHTHTDEGTGFEEVTNDHRFVFPAPDRMLYCQHVPGATDYAENVANVTLNDATIELPGGEYGYTVTSWSNDMMVWDNPVGGGYVYLLQRR